MGADHGFFKGEGGKVWKMDLPLPEDIAKQLAAGTLAEVDDPNPKPKPLTPKEQAQADAAALGLSTDGKVDEIKARVEAHVADLRKQGTDLGIADADKLAPADLTAAIDAQLAAAS